MMEPPDGMRAPRPGTASAADGALAAETATSAPLARKQSHQERISTILETGRKRAESLGHGSDRGSSRLQPLLAPAPAPAPAPDTVREDSSGDDREHDDGVVMRAAKRQGAMSYRSTDTTAPAAAPPRTPRSRLSQQSRDRRRTQQTGADGTGDNSSSNNRGSNVNGHDGDGRPKSRATSRGTGRASRWRRVLAKFQSMEVENKASVARDHLALERTFLAWLRTSLAFASIGIAVTQLFRLNTSLAGDAQSDTLRHVGKPLGAAFLAISILILLLGYSRFLQSQKWLLRGKFPASRATVLLVTLVSFAVMAASLIVVLAVRNGLT